MIVYHLTLVIARYHGFGKHTPGWDWKIQVVVWSKWVGWVALIRRAVCEHANQEANSHSPHPGSQVRGDVEVTQHTCCVTFPVLSHISCAFAVLTCICGHVNINDWAYESWKGRGLHYPTRSECSRFWSSPPQHKPFTRFALLNAPFSLCASWPRG